MLLNKIFDVSDIGADEIPSQVINLKSLHAYMFSVLWLRDGTALTLNSLVFSPYRKFKWQQVLPQVLTENDGEISLPLGLFQQGTKLDLIYNVYPHQNISAAALRVTNLNTSNVKQIAPATGFTALTKGKPWSAAQTIQLP